MIRLSSTSEKLQAVLAGSVTTNQLHCVVSYSDHTSTAYSGGTQYTSTNNTTAVDICAAPAASTVRDIDYINIRNRDTAVATVTVMVDVSAADSELVKATLAVGDHLVYVHGNGWAVIASDGTTKTGAGLADGDKGDITVASGTWTIDAGVVTLAKMANLAQDQFIGRTTASTGVPETATITAAARTVLDDTTVGDMRTTLGAAALGANTFTGLQTFAAGADIASATTVDLTAATGNLVRITGTTATTGVTINNGQVVICYPTGAWPLTYHATNMPIKGGVSYTCAAGDTVIFSKDGNGSLHVDIFKADGTALVAGAAAIPLSLIDAAGDLIVGTAADTAGRLAIGTALQQLRVNSGATALEWASASGGLLAVTTFTANGTWNKSTNNPSKIMVMAVGGGSAGRGTTGTETAAGVGGNAGAINWAYTASPASSYTITIGAGGTGASGNVGGDGGTTSVGALVSASGGKGGSALCTSGNTNQSSGSGASCIGQGAAGRTTAGAGNAAAANTGAGGGGAYDGASSYAGGAGGSGIVIIWEFA